MAEIKKRKKHHMRTEEELDADFQKEKAEMKKRNQQKTLSKRYTSAKKILDHAT